ncbi:TonB-dependent siderophore receptor [Rhizobium sp. SSA_523]|uniref:TonB-dependent siderophore receptor n=1 Tax=Rhizobium sp. SSA_523 TaxID=2952477 RepID=UPI002091539F|nr:TonB-dependent siderophore receptor [Rhizobium sp. SSA_523]MCO5733218.1 TonB-dependent siderophore receptor [Rhizobium sp. SSA_523]WKC22557.1 TonB-dependent siderophore receptor [Rhizobium sp. SSA_523]
MNMKRFAKSGSWMSGRSARLLGCTALVVLQPFAVLAQDSAASTDGGTVLDRITIRGSGGGDDDSRSIVAGQTTGAGKMPTAILDTPASVSVITAKEIQQRNASTIEEVLRYTAGVSTDFYGSDDRFDYFKIRGFDAYTYRDGLVIGRPFGGIREEAYAYERVEVLKGASSTAFGVSDPGGSVNYVSKKPKSERFGEAYVTGGSHSRAETGIDFGDNITEDDTLSYRLTGKLRKSDAEYDYSRDDERFFMGGLTWRPSDATSLTFIYDHLHKDGVPGGGGHPIGTDFDRSRFFGEPDYNYRGTNRNSFSVMLDHDFGTGLTLGSTARYSKTNSDFGYAYIASTPTNGSTIANRSFFGNDSAVESFVMDAHLQYDASFDTIDSRTLVGIEYNRTRIDNRAFFGAAPGINWLNPVYTGRPASVPLYQSQKTDQDTKAIYAQQDLTFSDKLIASVSLRNDWLDTEQTNRLSGVRAQGDVSELTSRFGVTYRWTEEFATYASYAQSVVPSSLTVEPERGEQYEVGVKYQPLAFPALFTAAVYDLTKNNITRTDPVTNLQSAIGEVRVRGVDLEAKAEIDENWSLTAAYSYLSSEIVENGTQGNEGNELAFVPHHTASLWATYALPGDGRRGDMTFSVGGRYSSSYYFNDANTLSTDGHIVFDAAVTYDLAENTSLEVNVSNVFDEKHLDYGGFGADFYNPGRTIMATLRQTW